MWSFLVVTEMWLSYLVSEPNSERVADISNHHETDDDSKDGHLSEAFYEAHAHPPEDETHE